LLAGLLQGAHQGFGAGQSLERLLNIVTEAGARYLAAIAPAMPLL